MQAKSQSFVQDILTRRRLHELKPIIAVSCILSLSNTTYAVLDSDGNGLSDVWQKRYKVTAILGTSDPDGDGYSNAQEATFGTDPMDASSHPYAQIQRTGPLTLRAQWPSASGKRYTFQSSSDLQTWRSIRSSMGKGGAMIDEVSGEAGQPFFVRIGANDVDSDGDGLSDWEEYLVNFNPQRAYSEGLGSTSSNNPITDSQDSQPWFRHPQIQSLSQ